jgi:hypothetical protein
MRRATRNTLTLMASLVLLSGLMMAQPRTNKADKNKSSQHHSKLAKLAFWRHQKGADNKAQKQTPSKNAHAKRTQVKPASAKQTAGKADQKHEQMASNKGNPSVKKTPATQATKLAKKAQHSTTDSSKQ